MTKDVRAEIEASNREFMDSFKRGDAAAVAALYTSGGQLLPANSDVVQGADAIRTFWQGAMDMGLKEAVLQTMEVETHGDTAVEVGRYRLALAGGVQADHGKYVVIWKNQSGRWKLHRDIWNTSQPPAAG